MLYNLWVLKTPRSPASCLQSLDTNRFPSPCHPSLEMEAERGRRGKRRTDRESDRREELKDNENRSNTCGKKQVGLRAKRDARARQRGNNFVRPWWLFVPSATDLISLAFAGPVGRHKAVKGCQRCQNLTADPCLSLSCCFSPTSLLPLKLRVSGSWQSNIGRRERCCFCAIWIWWMVGYIGDYALVYWVKGYRSCCSFLLFYFSAFSHHFDVL